jgi:ABC-2 type transport system ATP-binding protein
VIFSSHILPDAEVLCDRVAILTRGALREVIDLRGGQRGNAFQLTVSGVSAETRATFERIGGAAPTPDGGGWLVRLPGSPEVGSALDLVRGKAGTVESLVPVHASLEERFLAHVGRVTILTDAAACPRLPATGAVVVRGWPFVGGWSRRLAWLARSSFSLPSFRT